MPCLVAVCGPSRDCTDDDKAKPTASASCAPSAAITLCGGGVGVMAAVASGVRSRDGVVVGIRPNDTRDEASPDLSVTIVTNDLMVPPDHGTTQVMSAGRAGVGWGTARWW
ncbi:MAG: hypothetical protein ACRDRX_11465 [Pseudonocardiaceae bacterium]